VLQYYVVCCVIADKDARQGHGSAVAHGVLQCVAACCSVWQCGTVCCSVLQCVAVCCSVLQCVAMCCSVLQCVAHLASEDGAPLLQALCPSIVGPLHNMSRHVRGKKIMIMINIYM